MKYFETVNLENEMVNSLKEEGYTILQIIAVSKKEIDIWLKQVLLAVVNKQDLPWIFGFTSGFCEAKKIQLLVKA
jgi:hypothetical protein